MAENINVPSRHTQKWHWNGLNNKKCHETTKITFDSYCETPCTYMQRSTNKDWADIVAQDSDHPYDLLDDRFGCSS